MVVPPEDPPDTPVLDPSEDAVEPEDGSTEVEVGLVVAEGPEEDSASPRDPLPPVAPTAGPQPARTRMSAGSVRIPAIPNRCTAIEAALGHKLLIACERFRSARRRRGDERDEHDKLAKRSTLPLGCCQGVVPQVGWALQTRHLARFPGSMKIQVQRLVASVSTTLMKVAQYNVCGVPRNQADVFLKDLRGSRLVLACEEVSPADFDSACFQVEPTQKHSEGCRELLSRDNPDVRACLAE